MASLKQSTYLTEAWLPSFLRSKGLESLNQRSDNGEEMKYYLTVSQDSLVLVDDTLVGH